MERTRPDEGRSDRELREELEQAQGELRRVRAALEADRGGGQRAVAALQDALAKERAHRDVLRARLEAFAAQKAKAERALAWLGERLRAEQREAALLLRGAQAVASAARKEADARAPVVAYSTPPEVAARNSRELKVLLILYVAGIGGLGLLLALLTGH